jgi:hypothetical protein
MNRLEHSGLLESFVGFLLLLVFGVQALHTHSCAIEGGMRNDLDGSLIFHNRRNAMLGTVGSD